MTQDPFAAPILVWLRRDLRLRDNPALAAAAASGRPVVPVFLWDPVLDALGAAPRFRFGRGLLRFQTSLKQLGSALVLRRGEALSTLQCLVAETGATALYWNRQYDPDGIDRDRRIKKQLSDSGLEVRSFMGNLLCEPWQVKTGSGGHYRVYSPFWRALSQQDIAPPLPAPTHLRPPAQWPHSDALVTWQLDRPIQRGAEVVAPHMLVGEAAAQAQLAAFLEEKLPNYADHRDLPAQPATSGLSEPLAYGEVSARDIWHQTALRAGGEVANKFLKELAWRDFAWHLTYHDPHILTSCWRPEWQGFHWHEDMQAQVLQAWQQGRTGVPLVDAGMRELFVTGKMHNRVRMVAASFLTKHLRTHWRLGQAWFANTLVDWDPASNAMGWQWVAGCGPDAAPYFRIFNPETQRAKFDPDQSYTRRWLAELSPDPGPGALAFFDAAPRQWQVDPAQCYPSPIVDLAAGRQAALAALAQFKAGAEHTLSE